MFIVVAAAFFHNVFLPFLMFIASGTSNFIRFSNIKVNIKLFCVSQLVFLALCVPTFANTKRENKTKNEEREKRH